jgi:hypothetical protein
MIQHFLDNQFAYGEVVSLTRQPRFTPQEDSWYTLLLGKIKFVLELE